MFYKKYGKDKDLYRPWGSIATPGLDIVLEGEYRGRQFIIGAHNNGYPVAYLEVKKSDIIYDETTHSYSILDTTLYHSDILSSVNGGSTYFGTPYWDPHDERKYVGWGYCHYRDYTTLMPEEGGKKWRLIEILMEVAAAEQEISMFNKAGKCK